MRDRRAHSTRAKQRSERPRARPERAQSVDVLRLIVQHIIMRVCVCVTGHDIGCRLRGDADGPEARGRFHDGRGCGRPADQLAKRRRVRRVLQLRQGELGGKRNIWKKKKLSLSRRKPSFFLGGRGITNDSTTANDDFVLLYLPAAGAVDVVLVGNSPARPLFRRRHRDTVRGAGRAAPEPGAVRVVPRRVRQHPVPAEGRAQAELSQQRRAQDGRVRRRKPGECVREETGSRG